MCDNFGVSGLKLEGALKDFHVHSKNVQFKSVGTDIFSWEVGKRKRGTQSQAKLLLPEEDKNWGNSQSSITNVTDLRVRNLLRGFYLKKAIPS